MDIKNPKDQIKRRLKKLISEGGHTRDRIEQEYRDKCRENTFDPEKDIQFWCSLFDNWMKECLKMVNDLFEPPILIINRLKNPTIVGSSPSGENRAWAIIMKGMEARLKMLDELYLELNSIKQEEFSDYLEVSSDAPGNVKIKSDKIMEKIF